MPFHPLPAHLHEHVLAHQYYPFFGHIHTARVATIAINCGPAEARVDRLGFRRCGLDLTTPLAQQRECLHDAATRPLRYFDQDTTPCADSFWSFFNPGGPAGENPIHREHYFSGALAHVDVTPWATAKVWSKVSPHVREGLLALGRPALLETLEAATQLRCLVVRGVTPTTVLADALGAPAPAWQPIGERFRLAEFTVAVGQRRLPVVALNQFRQISGPVAHALVQRVRAHVPPHP